jgi:hypothetical protein
MPILAAFLLFVGIFFLHPFVLFPPLPGPDPCAGVSSSVRSICNTYCTVENCDEVDGSRAVCKQLRFSFLHRTGRHVFPCDLHLPSRATHTPTEPVPDTPTAEVETPTATAEPEVTNTAEPTTTETPEEAETETPTATFTPIDTFTATSAPDGGASE